eukprot:COSAG02_NODE_67792_length_252_cov_0.666667_1_plen_74_part_10
MIICIFQTQQYAQAQNTDILDEFDTEDPLSITTELSPITKKTQKNSRLSTLWESNGQGYFGSYYNHGKYEKTTA